MTEKQPLEQTAQTSLPPKITKADLDQEAASTKGKVFYWIKTVVYLLLSSFLVSFSAHALITPNQFTIGGASGIAILVNVASNGAIPISATSFAINAPLVVISFFFVKRKFAVVTASHIAMQTLWLVLLETVFPNLLIEFSTNGEKIFAAIAAGLCIGVAIALAFKIGGSTGGADIVAVMIQRKFSATSISWVLFALNCLIIGASIFVFYDPAQALAYNLLPVMMAAFESYIESKTNDAVTNGFHSAIEFRIITVKPNEMAQVLMRELSRGVTALPATGMYTQTEKSMLLCVISRRQVVTLKRIMKQVDPESFAVMANVSQVLGLGFYNEEM